MPGSRRTVHRSAFGLNRTQQRLSSSHKEGGNLDYNILTKSFGSNNPTNLVKATMAALADLRPRHEVERLRGVTLS